MLYLSILQKEIMVSIQLFRDKSPRAQYNWHFHWQFLKKPRSVSNLEYGSPLLCPGQIFLHIWVKTHEELCEKAVLSVLLPCTNASLINPKGNKKHQGTGCSC